MKIPLILFAVSGLAIVGLIAQTSKQSPAKPASTAVAVTAPTAPPAAAATPAPAISASAPPPSATPKPGGATGKQTSLVSTDLSGRDLLFLTNALEHGRVQQYLGELAKKKGSTPQVKAMGDVFSSTQGTENQKLSELALSKGIKPPAADSASKKALAKRLEALEGPKFDKALVEEIIASNQRALTNYENAQQTKDGEIKAFVGAGIPMTKEKLLLANKMSGTSTDSGKTPGFPDQRGAGRALTQVCAGTRFDTASAGSQREFCA